MRCWRHAGLRGIMGSFFSEGFGALGALVDLALTIIALVTGTFSALYAWIGVGLLRRDPAAMWLAVFIGDVFALLTLVSGPSGPYVGSASVLERRYRGTCSCLAGDPSYVRQGQPGDPPARVEAAAALARWVAFYLVLNGTLLVVISAQVLTGGYATVGEVVWWLILAAVMLVSSVVVVRAGASVPEGSTRARMIITVVASSTALLILVTDNQADRISEGTWINIGPVVVTLALLWLPISSDYLGTRRAQAADR